MFDDVMDEFCQLDLIRSRFEKWKKDYADSYNEAFIGLCLPKLFTPFVKLELVCWNPLEPSCPDFEDSRWFNSLVFYGHAEGQEPADDDLKLIPNIVDKVLMSKLTTLVESVWDPLSLQQSMRLVKFVVRLINDYPTVNAESKNTQILLKAVVQRIKKTLDDDVFMPLYPKQILENRSSDAASFFHRQFWTCIKLLRSIVAWHGVLSDRQLMELAFDSLVNRYLIVALQNSVFNAECLVKCKAMVEALPKAWFNIYKSDVTLPQLENLCRCLVNLVAPICTPQPPQTVLTKETRDLIRQIIKLLLSVNAKSHASFLASRASLSVHD
jgi:GC-rich sequence DNA-binding factor